MTQIVPDAIQHYIAGLCATRDDLLAEVAASGRLDGVPIVHDDTGRLLRVLVQATGARRVLEIGTAVGYSGLWIAGGLQGEGSLLTMERDPARAARARANFERAGVAARVSVIVGDVTRYLHKVAGPFDLIFQDGDKALYGPLLERLIALLRPGGVLVTDNVLWGGAVVPGYAPDRAGDAHAETIAAYNERLAGDTRLLTTILPVGDGVAISVKRGDRAAERV